MCAYLTPPLFAAFVWWFSTGAVLLLVGRAHSGVLKVLSAEPAARPPAAGSIGPGTALDDRLLVAAGDGALRLLVVQRPGRAPMPAEARLRGFAVPSGTRLG